MPALKLPPTVRFARINELPPTEENARKIALALSARLVPGYTIRPNTGSDKPFRFFAEINVDNDRLWHVFKTLAAALPPEVSLIFHHKDEVPSYSPYVDRDELLQSLEPYFTELTQDSMLCTGLLHYTDKLLEEVFITPVKYLQYWGSDEQGFRDIMSTCGLAEEAELEFIDQYPRAAEALSLYAPDCLDTWELLGKLLKLFGKRS